jgi:hypothetical protein
MSLPREGSRATGEGLVISTCPDVCLTPQGAAMVPVPYSITAKQSDDARTTRTVHMTGLRVHTKASIITTCTGDEPGSGKGVKSGTVEGICEPLTYSSSVRAESSNVVRNDDVWWMNDRNTIGKLVYQKNMQQYAQARTGTMSDALPSAKPSPGVAAPSAGLPTGSQAVGGASVQALDSLMGGLIAQRQVQTQMAELQGVLDSPSNPPLTDGERGIVQNAIDDIRANDLPTGNVASAQAKVQKAIDDVSASVEAREKAKAQDNVRVTKAKEIPCFNRNPKHDKKEFDRQLKEQEDELNNTSPDDYLDRKANPPDRVPEAQQAARDDYVARRTEELAGEGTFGAEAQAQIAQEMKGLDATHALDIIARGDPNKISGLADRGVNRSIGPQWTKGGRLEALDQAAEEAKARGDKKLKVKLRNCEDMTS